MKMRMEYIARREEQHVCREEERVKQLRQTFYEKHPIPVQDCLICAGMS